MLVVDGGYLSFKLAFGGFEKWQMKHGEKVSMFAIDNKPKRREIYPQYKQGRNQNQPEVKQMVSELRNKIETEKVLPFCSIEGLEADDLVACWYLFNTQDQIVGVDKDFFQLPNLKKTYYHTLANYYKDRAIEKLPVFVQPLARQNFALYQILLGDVADNIPRLLAKGKEGKKQIAEAYTLDMIGGLHDWLLEIFGEQAKINAALVLLPYYEFGKHGDWLFSWCDGDYYNPLHWMSLYESMLGCLGENKTAQEKAVWDLFS